MTVPGGPPCQFCDGQEPAIITLMNVADYSQTAMCPACAPGALRGIADLLDPAAATGEQAGGQLAPHTEHDIGPRQDGGISLGDQAGGAAEQAPAAPPAPAAGSSGLGWPGPDAADGGKQ